MRKYDARRQTILNFVARKGGLVRAAEIHEAILAAGLYSHRSRISRYVRPLVRVKLLAIVGKGLYQDAAARAHGTERFLDRLPYGTQTAGRILHYMLTRRYVRTTEVTAYLLDAGLVSHRQVVYTAFWQLQREGYVERVSQGTYALTNKTLALVSLPSVCDEQREFKGPWGRQLWPHVTELLRTIGPTTQKILWQHLTRRGFPVNRFHVYAAVRQMRGHGTVAKRSRGRYAHVEPAATDGS